MAVRRNATKVPYEVPVAWAPGLRGASRLTSAPAVPSTVEVPVVGPFAAVAAVHAEVASSSKAAVGPTIAQAVLGLATAETEAVLGLATLVPAVRPAAVVGPWLRVPDVLAVTSVGPLVAVA